ncbi:MAG: tRNA (N6-isopentenyl adenosine(37)-C2)-methylthiotransferase MiaB [Candidatus Cloacimonadales bacterium]|nr:tRNA (N6-isopentenyl adenosine(37)-C2)-methylthiotransferase MiaB [Candidatus Cloacimonadota bacterium]MDD3502420.1 tRNA (N6-isopentenyl adenosine(37)-C2)-methylthiotransferase MiaB [Candidatus Cloacimonadota bacterium]MDX9976950.1 tRNA (N6-isopentenyl adenosine(37)-C2)-methylthiotransferase MiaB [Candidatus Cloacimonadales bacterium]
MKFIIETYGCQMNVADSEMISTIMENSGYELTDSVDDADIIMFNTCSVRQNAEDRVIGRISNEVARKFNNKQLIVGVVGCMAQRLGKELNEINSKIDFVVGVDNYFQLPQIIEQIYNKRDFVYSVEMNHQEIYNEVYPVRKNNLNAFVTIMRGCNNFCTYCIVPYVRGRERSRSIDEVLNEIRFAGENGIQEVTLLGQNVNSYLWKDINFPKLLQQANKIDNIKRIRFVTSHPKDLSDELIETMANYDKICEHIHLPVQSGNNEILKMMNRNYTVEHYLNRINKLRELMPDIAITTDVIAGFPGESNEQFMDTYKLMEEVRYDFAFMFKYSPRTGTKAADYSNQIDEEIRLQRLQKLIDLQTEITHEKYKNQIGQIKEVYVEGPSKKDINEYSGKSRDFKITIFPGDESLVGKFVDVKVEEAAGWTLKGHIIK